MGDKLGKMVRVSYLILIIFFLNLSKIFKKYNLSFSSEFNQIVLSLNSCNSLAKILCKSVTNTQYNCIEEIIQVNKLITI